MQDRELESGRWEEFEAHLPNGSRIYAIGDIHGRADLLRAVLLKIVADINNDPIRWPMIVFLGDYIDRGPHSSDVIELILTVRRVLPTICLSGNHELYALRFIRDSTAGRAWLDFGGRETLSSYGVAVPWRMTARTLENLSLAFAEAMPQQHLRFLATLGLTFSLGDYLFVHAGIQPNVPVAEQDQSIATLIREPFLEHAEEFGRIVVHGHTPVAAPDIRRHRINIDTGAYVTGRLTCIVLENGQLRLL